MLRQPVDVPTSLGHVGESAAVQSLRALRAGEAGRGRWSPRAWAGRFTGRSDRRLLRAIADATEELAAHCDLMVDRLDAQHAVAADVTGAFSAELAQLHAEVLHLQRVARSQGDPGA
jgi:hypothetical protein